VYMPYHVTWAHELDAGFDPAQPRFATVAAAREIPAALATLSRGTA
jgi:putative hydrolase of the HAD superfamily